MNTELLTAEQFIALTRADEKSVHRLHCEWLTAALPWAEPEADAYRHELQARTAKERLRLVGFRRFSSTSQAWANS